MMNAAFDRLADVLAAIVLLVAGGPEVRFAKPHLIAGHFAVEPRIPLAADLDGDGFADLACVYPPDGGIIDIGLSERGLKMHAPRDVAHGLLGEAVAAAARPGEVAWLTRDGVVGVHAGYAGGKPRELARVREPAGALLASGAGWLVPRPTGVWTLVPADGSAALDLAGPSGYEALAAFGETVFWTDGRGALHRSALAADAVVDETLAADGCAGAPLVAGDFDGDGRADALCGSRLFLAARGKRPLAVEGLPPDGIRLAADFTKDGRSDLVWCRRDGAPHVGRDILLLVAYGPTATDRDGDGLADAREQQVGSDPLARDTDEDAIPDLWEVDGFGGFDFGAEGFHPARKDVLCYVQRRVDTDGARVRAELERCRAYFASLRIPIALHIRFLPALAREQAEGKPWWDLGNAALPPALRGLAHYMVTGPGGGGQSAQLGDMGGCGADALYATFLHEFGHQLGLDHTGFYPEPWCPLYTSLMNYAYNYGFDGDGNKIHYSSGQFASHPLNESDLREVLPYPIDRVRFLAKGPFHFKLEAAGPEATRIDWNRNGVFDDGPVKADINTSYSTDGGHRSTIGKTVAAPALVAHAGKAHLFSVNPERKLERRDYEGGEKWSAPVVVHDEPATGDPFAISWGEELHVLLPTARGVVDLADGRPLPASDGCGAGGVVHGGRLLVFLWREGKVRLTERSKAGWSNPVDFPLASTFPPGAVEDGRTGELLVGVGEDQDDRRKSRWRLYRLRAKEGGGPGGGFEVLGSRWLAGEGSGDAGNRRPNLLYEAAESRLHWIATGMVVPQWGERACFYDEMTIGDASFRDGWLLKRYYDEWTTSQSAVGACWFDGDILLACRWFGGADASNDNLFVAHRGLGIGNRVMADFDDVAHMANVGLARSILWLQRK